MLEIGGSESSVSFSELELNSTTSPAGILSAGLLGVVAWAGGWPTTNGGFTAVTGVDGLAGGGPSEIGRAHV